MKEREEDISLASFWDERYTKSSGETPTHEWFKTFESLEPFFQKHLLDRRAACTDPCILQLGCGDSVSVVRIHLVKGWRLTLVVDRLCLPIYGASATKTRYVSTSLPW